MILTVTTVKDELRNVRRFVEANLAGGIDHMLLLLDGADAEVEEWLGTRPEVTAVVTDRDYWNGARPRLLNRRQWVNANLARAVLAGCDWAEWLFHVDADEVASIDRDALARVPGDRSAVRLEPLEVVSRMHWDAPPTWFKPLLEEPELDLLVALGIIAEPTNSLWFRSHIAGKVGIRPQRDVRLGIHKATDPRGNRLPLFQDPGLTMLHFESYSGEEFVRKWRAMIGSGPKVHFGPYRMRLANAVKAILERPLEPEVAERYLTEIYRRHMEDPFETLRDLGLVVERDPLRGGHVPEPLMPERRAQLAAAVETYRSADKQQFIPASSDKTQSRPSGRRLLSRRHSGKDVTDR
ncbi:MAG: glycosyltransferase family 2 protein [Marmoricola sp.]